MVNIDAAFERALHTSVRARHRGVAVAARFDNESHRIVVSLDSRIDVSIPPELIEGLQNGTPSQWTHIEITPSGLGLHWPDLDADLYIPALLEGVLGTNAWMARQLGTAGGMSKSDKKIIAARENGKKGGRPKKNEEAHAMHKARTARSPSADAMIDDLEKASQQ